MLRQAHSDRRCGQVGRTPRSGPSVVLVPRRCLCNVARAGLQWMPLGQPPSDGALLDSLHGGFIVSPALFLEIATDGARHTSGLLYWELAFEYGGLCGVDPAAAVSSVRPCQAGTGVGQTLNRIKTTFCDTSSFSSIVGQIVVLSSASPYKAGALRAATGLVQPEFLSVMADVSFAYT